MKTFFKKIEDIAQRSLEEPVTELDFAAKNERHLTIDEVANLLKVSWPIITNWTTLSRWK